MPSNDVVIGFMWNTDTAGQFTFSLASLVHYDGRHNQRIQDLISLSTGPRVAEARNCIVDIFAKEHPDAEWLLMLDSDMVFDANLVDLLMREADPEKAPIVGGLCFSGGRTNAPYPTIFRGIEKNGYASIERVYDYPRNSMVRVQATGGACLLIHRGALGAMKNAYGEKNPVYPWFAEGVTGPENEPWGEDTVFCLRANAIGIPVWVHTGVKLGHVKPHIVDERYFDNFNKAQEMEALSGNGFTKPGGHNNRAARRKAAREKVS